MAGLRFEQYEHHGKLVWVRSDLKGTHRDVCLCYTCAAFHPEDRERNCPIANALFDLDVKYDLVTPVFECAAYVVPVQEC